MNPEQPSGIGGRPFSPPDHLHDLGFLLPSELRLSATDAPFVSSIGDADLGAFAQHGPFELRKRPEHLEHHTARRRYAQGRSTLERQRAGQLDRLVHNAYRIELNGESIRKKRGRKPEE